MTVYPVDFPAAGVARSTFRLQRAVSIAASPFTGQQQAYDFGGAWWEGEVTFRPMTYAQAAEVKAFVTALRGCYGTFLYGDPDHMARGNRGSGGVLLVNGGGQTGRTLALDGMVPMGVIGRAGDYFQIGAGESARLYMLTQDLIADAGGAGVAQFEPELRQSPADNTALVFTNAKCAMRLSENAPGWGSDARCITEVTIAFREAL